MARRPSSKKPAASVTPRVSTDVSFPSHAKPRKTKSVGVTAVRRQQTSAPGARTMGGYAAAEACDLFGRPNKGGGNAFLRWLEANYPETASNRMSAEDWAPLLHEFAERPIHGHRRTSSGGNHRINKTHRR